MTLNIVAWHDRTQANHLENLNRFAADGYRTLSLSVYGERSDPRYAAVMIKRPTVHASRQFFAGYQRFPAALALARFQGLPVAARRALTRAVGLLPPGSVGG
jgi:hypothetical protein